MPTAPRTMRPWPRLNDHQRRRVERLRWMGRWVLAASLVLAILVYRLRVATYEPTLQELLPDSAAAVERQRGILFGRGGAVLLSWLDAAERPAGQAVLLVFAGLIGAAVFYQAAHRIEVDEG